MRLSPTKWIRSSIAFEQRDMLDFMFWNFLIMLFLLMAIVYILIPILLVLVLVLLVIDLRLLTINTKIGLKQLKKKKARDKLLKHQKGLNIVV